MSFCLIVLAVQTVSVRTGRALQSMRVEQNAGSGATEEALAIGFLSVAAVYSVR